MRIEEGEELCDECKGVGTVEKSNCPKCSGSGKMDGVCKLKTIVDLAEGEMICDKCNGKGTFIHGSFFKKDEPYGVSNCEKCRGAGKVDWIENIIGTHPFKIVKRAFRYIEWSVTKNERMEFR